MWGKLKKNHFELGIVLANIGTQISVITREFLPHLGFNLTHIMFLFSLLLLFDYKTLLKCSMPKPSKIMLAILIYNLYALVNGIIVGASFFDGSDALLYTLYIIIMWFCVNTNQKNINTDYLINAIWGITGIYSCLLFYILTDHFKNFAGISFTVLPSGADRLTLSFMGFMHLCVTLVYDSKKIPNKFLKYIFAFIAFYDLMICSRRGLLISLILIALLHIYQKYNKKLTPKKLLHIAIGIICIVLILIIIYLFFPNIATRINSYFHVLIIGLNTYFGNFSGGIDAAAISRNIVINTVPLDYLRSSFVTIIFGNGYGHRQLDFPYLQAFTDLGILAGIYYFFIQCIYPVKAIIKKSENKAVILLKYIGITTVMYNLYTGVPYGHYKFVGLIMLFYAVNMNKNWEMG